MGRHRAGQMVIGCYIDFELRDYLDKLADERGYLSRSDSLRAVIVEHRTVFADRIDGTQALTPSGVAVNGNHHRGKK